MTGKSFAVGDKVALSSGGPTMSIASIAADGIIETQWFDSAQKLCTGYFRAAQLIEPPKAPGWGVSEYKL